MLLTGVGAAAGSVFFEGAELHLFAIVEGLASGAMLTMIAETMVPEAYLRGGNVVGLSTLAGFLIAIFSKTLEPVEVTGDRPHGLARRCAGDPESSGQPYSSNRHAGVMQR